MKKHVYISISGFALKCVFVISLFIGFNSQSQTDPVQATVTTSPPFLNYLSYYGDQNNHLQITLTNLDFATPPILARLRIRIQGSGWEVYTNPNATIGQPFLLEAGMPVTITGIELLPYLQANNLINPNEVDLNNLPQGWTDFCVDVIRVSASQQVLATNSCGFATIQNVQPPTPNFPACGTRLDTTSMFENFQWFASNPPAVGMGIETLYDLNIYHWYDTTNFSQTAWAYNPVYSEPNINFGESFVVPMNQIPFVQGGKYVWTVTARILVNGIQKNVITNNGVSAPCIFYYGQAQSLNEILADGLELELFTQASAERKGKAWWTVTDNTPNQGLSTFDEFYVEYRKQPTGNEGFEIPWFHKTLSTFEHFIYQLEPRTTYEVKVSGIIGGVVGDPTPVETFTTPDPRVYNCGESDLPFLPSAYTPLENATAGTQVQIGQFTMTMTQVNATGQTGHYAGKGEIPIAFLAGAKAKVTFNDILIDTEYRVREGRVDVITEGLNSWLDNQMQQFIDPYYVDGTIDSAWVDTTAGVAWVVVDGVAQDFVFDPPHYPIIVNDASGNQYTIYPNGTIVVGTYLSVSETWAVAENETVRFGQNDSEERGFDPKEHQEWHENYETMKLSDNSFYYVANKSLAKNEGDKVNVQFPANVTHVRFELANGDTIPYAPLDGAWMGNKPYLENGLVKTLNLPSFTSGGKYEVFAFVDGVKVGQLNIQVYNEKTKDVIVVPIASISSLSLSKSNIEEELKRTLGEANINVNVTLETPWVDSTGTFTATTTISLPTEVGLLTKYSDEMRDLRDAYFEAHPSAPKDVYYLFVVNGFDDPSELGYMVRGRSMGFIKASSNQVQMLQTISHELGHGMGALEHSWKENGPAEGSTNNLMDYSVNARNLTIEQWKELRDLDVIPSLWDGTEDGQNIIAAINDYDIPDYLKNSDGSVTFITPANKPISIKGQISKLIFQTISMYGNNGSIDITENDLTPFGSLVGFTVDGIEYIMDIDENSQFLGYKDGLDSTYRENYSLNFIGDNACIGLPVYLEGTYGLGIAKSDLIISASVNNTGAGAKESLMTLISQHCNNLNSYETHLIEATIDYSDFTEEIMVLGDLLHIVDVNISLTNNPLTTASNSNYELGHYFGFSAYLVHRLLNLVKTNSSVIPCAEGIKGLLEDYFQTELTAQARRQAIATYYANPQNQMIEDEHVYFHVESFSQNMQDVEMGMIQSMTNGNVISMSLSNSNDVTMWEKNLVLQRFFDELDGLIKDDGSVNMTFISSMSEKARSQINNSANITDDFASQMNCLLATLSFNQRKDIIDTMFGQMQGTLKQNAKRTEIVLRVIESTPFDQFVQMKALLTANSYNYYEELANLKFGGAGVAYDNSYITTGVNTTNFINYSVQKQLPRSLKVLDKFIRYSNNDLVNSSTPWLPQQTVVQVVPLYTWGFLDLGSTTESSYSNSANQFDVEMNIVLDPLDPTDNVNYDKLFGPYDMVMVRVEEDFDASIVRPDNGQPLKAGDQILISALHLHKIIESSDNLTRTAYIRFIIETGLFVATAGGSVVLDGLEATIIGTQMLLEHNNVNIQQMQDGPIKTSVIALKDYGDLLIVGGALVSRPFSTGPRVPFISKTEQTGGLVKYTFHNDEVGLALQDMRASNKLDLNLTKIRTLINSLDGFTSYRMRSAKKHLEAFELDTKFQKLSGNSSRHYVHFDVNSQRPHFRFVYNNNGIAHSKHSLFDVAFENNQIRLSNIDWLPPYTIGNVTSIAKFANIRYPKEGQIVTGNIEIVRNSNGQFYMRIPPFDVFITRLNQLGLTDLRDKIVALSSTDKTKFFNGFSQAPDPLLTRMDQNSYVVDIWAGHTTAGQNLLASNVDVWLKHIEARTLQLNNQFSSIAQLFNENLVTPSSGYVASDMTSSQITSCNQIINSTTDIQSISTNTGIPANIITQVKEHFWVKTHLVRTDEGLKYGRFGKDDYDIQQWLDAQNGFQTTNIEDFKNLVAHEYVESKLMELGLHYRSLNAPYEYNPYNIGAHDMSPLLTNRQFLNAERLTSLSAVANDLGNLDQIIAELVQFYKL